MACRWQAECLSITSFFSHAPSRARCSSRRPLPLQVLALKELPSACAGGSKDVWRGVKLNLEKQFPQGSIFTWYGGLHTSLHTCLHTCLFKHFPLQSQSHHIIVIDRWLMIASLIRWAFTSATQRMEVLEDDTFLGTSGDRTLFMIQLNTAFDIKAFSFFPGQDEV